MAAHANAPAASTPSPGGTRWASAVPGTTTTMALLIGTSGWQYRHWRDVLYPREVPQRLWLEHYASVYATVENDGTFYRLPGHETFAAWRGRLPPDFVMAIKASRYLTHVRRLRDPAEPVARLMGAATGLGRHLGPVLLQLPPTLRADPGLLARCLAEFAAFGSGQAGAVRPDGGGPGPGRPGGHPARPGGSQAGPGQPDGRPRRPDGVAGGAVRVAVEPRHPSWWTDETRQVLTEYGAALCWADQLGRPVTPLWRTADWGYLRLHQGAATPWPRYGRQALRSWLGRLSQAWPGEARVHVYFNNDPGGAAVADSIAFAALARRAGLRVSRTPSSATARAGVNAE